MQVPGIEPKLAMCKLQNKITQLNYTNIQHTTTQVLKPYNETTQVHNIYYTTAQSTTHDCTTSQHTASQWNYMAIEHNYKTIQYKHKLYNNTTQSHDLHNHQYTIRL